MPRAFLVSPYRPFDINHLGDSGIRARSTTAITAGTAPRPRMIRQPAPSACSGITLKISRAIRKDERIPTVIIHCWMMLSWPRFFEGANSAMYAVAIAESAPTARPISVRERRSISALTVTADRIEPSAKMPASTMSRDLRPKRSVSGPAPSAPTAAPRDAPATR